MSGYSEVAPDENQMTRDEAIQRATTILRAIRGADVPTVARLAHALHELAEQEHLDEVANASIDLEHVVASDKIVSLTRPLSRLTAALNAIEQRPAA